MEKVGDKDGKKLITNEYFELTISRAFGFGIAFNWFKDNVVNVNVVVLCFQLTIEYQF